MALPDEQWVLPKEAAKILDCSPDAVRKMCQQRRLKGRKVFVPELDQKVWRIPMSVLKDFKRKPQSRGRRRGRKGTKRAAQPARKS